ncbi:MAG TPA: mechanosensitive ion channel domain-containing protein [Flavitalea sp.]|nr:mechanosensitive ion channel domain-containing protein [Flavitalea sp.]
MATKTDTSPFSLFDIIVRRLGKRILIFVVLILINFWLPLIPFSPKNMYVADKIIDIMLAISFAGILVSVVKVGEDYVYHRYDLNKTDNLKERKIRTQLVFLRKMIVVMIVIVTICVILLSFDNLRKIGTGLLTGVGVGGIIIGFAAQRSLGNLLAGFQIAFTQPLRIDDALLVEGEYGKVEEITLTYVVLNLWDQRRLILPINYFIEKPFQNWTRTTAELLGTVTLYLDYSVPLEAIRSEFNRLLEASALWDRRASSVQVTDVSVNNVELRLLVSAKNSGDAFDLRCYIRENMIIFVQKNYPESLPKTRMELRERHQV